ncbi:MAG TPA: DUF1631 family protein, partial [Quisquiliibacterium sp.]|nr:DUF1631 family protein [Quisquiliibacterium sp.]
MTTTAAPPPDRSELFEQTLDRLEASLVHALRSVIPAVAGDLERAGEGEPEQRDRQSLYAVAAMLRIETRARVAAAGRTLHDRARRCVEYLERTGDEGRALELVEEDELRVQILAAEIARALKQIWPGDYLAYASRARALMRSLWEDDEVNPIGARALATAALASFGGLGDTGSAAASLRASLSAHLPPALAEVLEDADRWLRSRGVEPLSDAAEATVPATADATADAAADAALDRAGDAGPEPSREASPSREVDATEQTARAAGVLARSPLAEGAGRVRLAVVPTLQPVVEVERDALAFAHSIGVVPYSREARAGFFGNARARLRGAGVPPAQAAVVDLVAAMFDYVVDDQRVPEAAKPLIWRLQQPAVALSLLDPAYLGDEPRSLRRLVENMGAIVNAFADDLSRGSELYRRLDTVVRAVEIVAGALQTRSAVIARQVEHEYERAARNVAQLIERVVQERSTLEAAPARRNRRDYGRRPDRVRELEVTERLSTLLAERIGRHEVPESVREFVLNVWLRHLRTAILRDGEESAEFRVALQVVDDLLWSLDDGKERQSRSQLAQKIPPLIRLLAQGLRAIGARDDEFKPFFDELFLIHLRKMQRRRRTGDTRNGLGETTRGGRRTRIPGEATRSGPRLSDGGAADARAPAAPEAGGTASGIDAPRDGSTMPVQATAPASTGRAGGPLPVDGDPDTRHGEAASSGDRKAAANRDGAAPDGDGDGDSDGSGRRLLEVLASLDLDDLPADPRERAEAAEQALEALRRGDWLRLGGDGEAP